ncbi:tetratricopeptide repeat protein (macronuclear) [Tetrahymena thermophila SB210]|uniref:Tetratricopeptide repeat protein n=1 Tax=Tetrahymena thermophila (strain SB210) TaxID=312017 RepID=I7M1H5_TETTS|nr:tetratricopeptide repeat protein [Tetrahymena thermophila SB210]EAR96357.2 tetratricopeptide repeat protein [Tetrahymena thermophila SB210]|eukprot:XP_001016602.2 tetratricopeptide repeat protein [Tetrahymena thermophila SB210]
MSTSVGTASYSKTQLPSKQTKIQARNQADEDRTPPSNTQNVKQNSNVSNNVIGENKKKTQISTNSTPRNGDLKNQQNSNIKQNEASQNQAVNKSPYKINQTNHNNGYYSQKSYREQRHQELEENFINKNLQIGEAIEKSQKDIRLKLSQQSHMADIFSQQPQSQQSLSDWKQDQHKNGINIYQQNQINNTSQEFIPQTPEAYNNESNNYYQYEGQNEYREQQKLNLKPSDTKLSDYLNLRNQVNSPSVHQRLYHQAVSQQKQQQQSNQLNDKQQNNHQSIFSVGPRNYSSEKHSQKFRSSSNRKQRPTYYSGTKIPPNEDGSFVNEGLQQGQNNFPQKYFSQSQDFGEEGNSSFINNSSQIPSSYQKQRNIGNSHHRTQSNNRYQSRQEGKRLNLPQIDQNLINAGTFPHSSTVRNSQKAYFSRQQSPLGSSNELATPNSRTPRIQYNRRDSSTRIKDLGNSIQERYSDKIEKMKLKYSSKNPFSQNTNLDDELDSHRYQQYQQNDGQQYNIQRKEYQQTIQQAAINIEEQRQKIRKHEEQRDQEIINQNYTYKDYNRRSNDFSPRFSKQDGQNNQTGNDIYEQNLQDNIFKQQKNQNDQIDKGQGNYLYKDQIRKLSSYNLKLNTTEERIQKILTKEDSNFSENQQMVKQFSQSSKISNNAHDNLHQQQPNQVRRGSLQNLDGITNKKQRYQDIDHVNMNQRDLLNENNGFTQSEYNHSNSPPNNSFNQIPRSDSKAKRIQQNYYYQQEPQKQINDNQEFVTLPNSQPQTPQQYQQKQYQQQFQQHQQQQQQQQQQQHYDNDDFSRNQTRNEINNRDNYTNEDLLNEKYNNMGNTQNTNIDDIYQRKRENVVKRAQEKLHSLNDKMETFDHVGDLKMKKLYHNLNPQIIENLKAPQHNQQPSYRQQNNPQIIDTFENTSDIKDQPLQNETKPQNQIKENFRTPQKQQITENNRSNSKRRDSIQKESGNLRYPHKSQNTTLIDTFEGEKNNIYNYHSMVNNQKQISKESSRFDTFDSKIKNQQSLNTEYQQKMSFLDKKLANLQQLKEKQKKQYFIESDNPRYHQPNKIEEEDERYRKTTNDLYDEQQQYYQYENPQTNQNYYEQDQNSKNQLNYSPKAQEKNIEIKNYNMVKKQPVKTINKNMNDLEKIQSNLGNIEKQLEQLNQKYHKYQPNQQVEEKDMEDRLFTFQVDERIYKKFKKYLPQDITQRANQIQKFEQFSTQLSDKKKYEEQQQLEDYLDNQIKNQLQKFLPLDVSQRLQIENESQLYQPLEASQNIEKNPQLEDYINKKIQERLMAYLPNDVIARMNQIPQENQKVKKKKDKLQQQMTKDSDRVLLEKMSPQEQEEFIRQKTEIVNEYKKQQEQLINEQYKLTDEKNIELEKQRIRMQLKSSERMARLDQNNQKKIVQNKSNQKNQYENYYNDIESKSQQQQQQKQLFQQNRQRNYVDSQRNGSRGGQNNILQQIDASESQYLTNNEQSISPRSTFYKNSANDEKTHSFFKNHNQNGTSVRQYNGVLSQENDDSESPKKAEVFGKLEQYVYKPPRSRSISPTRELNESINQSPDNNTKLNKSYIVKQRNGTNNSFLSKGKYSLFQQNNSNNQSPNNNPYLLQDPNHNQNVSFPAKSSIENQIDEVVPKQQNNQSQKQKSLEKVPSSLLISNQQGQIRQEKAPNKSYQFKTVQDFNFDQQQGYNDQSKKALYSQQKLDPMSISLSKNHKERNDQQQQNIKDDIIKDNQKSEKDLNEIQEDTKENISTIHNNSGIIAGNNSPKQSQIINGSIAELRYQNSQQQEDGQKQLKDHQKNNQQPNQGIYDQAHYNKEKQQKESLKNNKKEIPNEQKLHHEQQLNQKNHPNNQNQQSQSEQRQDLTKNMKQFNEQSKDQDMFKSDPQVTNQNQSNHFIGNNQNSQLDFTVQNKYDPQKETFNSLFQLSYLDTPFQSNIKMKVYNLQNSNPIDLDWEFKYMLQNLTPISPKLFQGTTYTKDQETSQVNVRQSTYISYNYNASNLCKEYFKDIHILYQINKEFRQNRENTPSPILLSLPVCFEINKNQLEIMCETSKFLSMTEMIRRRKNQSGQAYNENELAFIFHSILKSIEVFEKKGILHSYLTTDNLIYCIESYSYKLQNFSLSQAFSASDLSKNQRIYNIYYKQPYIQNEQNSQTNSKQCNFTPFYADRYALAISFFCIQQLIEPTEINQNVISRAIKLMEQKKDNASVSNQVILHLLNFSNQQQQDTYSVNQFWSQIFNLLDSIQHIQPDDEELASVTISNLDNQAQDKKHNVEYRSESVIKQLADQSYTTFQFSKSLDLYIQLLELQEQKYGKNDEKCIPTLNKIWKIYFSNNDFEKSYIYCIQYTELAKQNYQKQKKLHLQQTKKTQLTQIDSQQNTEQMSAFNKLQRNLVTDFNLSGQLKWQLDKKQEAIGDYEMALQLQIEIYGENEYNVIKNINNIGVYYSNINQMDKAIEIIKNAISKMEQQNITDQLYTSALYNIGNLLSDNGQLSEALPYLTKSYEIKKKTLGNNQEVGKLAHLIGTLHFQLKSYQQSLSFLEEAVQILQKFSEPDDSEYIKYKRNYIVSLVKNNLHQQANQQIESILQALSQSTFQSFTETPSQVYYDLGSFLEKILKYDYAKLSYEQSINQLKSSNVEQDDATLQACLKRINSLQNKIENQQKSDLKSQNQEDQQQIVSDKMAENKQNKQQDQKQVVQQQIIENKQNKQQDQKQIVQGKTIVSSQNKQPDSKQAVQDKMEENNQNKQQDQKQNNHQLETQINKQEHKSIDQNIINNPQSLQPDNNHADIKPKQAQQEANNQNINNIVINDNNQNKKEVNSSNLNSNNNKTNNNSHSDNNNTNSNKNIIANNNNNISTNNNNNNKNSNSSNHIQSFSNIVFDDNKNNQQQQQNLKNSTNNNSKDVNQNNQNTSIPYQLKVSSNIKQNQAINQDKQTQDEANKQGDSQIANQNQHNQIKTDKNKDSNQGTNNQQPKI